MKKQSKRKSWWEVINGRFFVWTWQAKYRRYVNTHVYEKQRDAELTVR